MNRKYAALFITFGILIVLSGCVPGDGSSTENNPAGFWSGLWHGLILLFTFIGSLFSDNITIYEVANNGNWYNFGYFLGLTTAFGGGGSASSK